MNLLPRYLCIAKSMGDNILLSLNCTDNKYGSPLIHLHCYCKVTCIGYRFELLCSGKLILLTMYRSMKYNDF